jgi:hypothetical protein
MAILGGSQRYGRSNAVGRYNGVLTTCQPGARYRYPSVHRPALAAITAVERFGSLISRRQSERSSWLSAEST